MPKATATKATTAKVAVSLPDELFRALESARRRARKTRSAVVQEALRDWLRRQARAELVRDYEALDQDEKTINVHVSHLREKLEDDPTNPSFILTVRGAGYAFAER